VHLCCRQVGRTHLSELGRREGERAGQGEHVSPAAGAISGYGGSGKMQHGRPKRPGDSTGVGRVWSDQGLARNGGDQPTCALVAGQTVGSGNKGIGEAERLPSPARKSRAVTGCSATGQTKPMPNRIRTTSDGLRTGSWLMPSRRYANLLKPNEI
jgi:hypothetical protein